MPTGIVDSERADAAAAQEFPDRTGLASSDNPYLAVFRPYIPSSVHLRELTPLPLLMGTVLGIIFGASSLYLVLKVGLTVSASIPVAVISITLFRVLSKMGLRDATILENNIVQTAGSAGESIAFGLGVTMPAIMILGFDLEITRVMLVATLGGLIGILMMIPLRRALIVQQHGYLKYPEGTACAEVLKAGASEESRAAAHTDEASGREADAAVSGGKVIIGGFGIGFVYYALEQILKTWKEVPQKVFGKPFEGGSLSLENNPALLGVGYIIGPRISSIMVAGGVLSYLVLIPAIKYFGAGLVAPLAPETAHTISSMTVAQIQKGYILYIGAGAVAAGGIISLFRSLPIIWHGLKGGIADLRGSRGSNENAPRIDQDLSMKWVLGGIIGLLIVIMIAPQLNLRFNILGAVLIIAFGFLFVTVSSRLTGEVGSSSNPISGMTVATLLLTCLVFLIIGWTAPPFFVTALSIGGIVCIASSNGGTTSQDLKTGFLVGATPKYQQVAILVGALASALILGPILLQLNKSGTIYAPRVMFTPADKFSEAENATLSVAPGAASALPSYNDDTRPPVSAGYRLLQVAKGDVAPVETLKSGEYQVDERGVVTPKGGGAAAGSLKPGEYLVGDDGHIAYRRETNWPADLRANPAELGTTESLEGAQANDDRNAYRVWQKTTTENGPAARYLVNNEGVPVYIVDPGINGVFERRPDGSSVQKFTAPKATLMSYIIKGILSGKLPWGLVLLGVFIAIVLELSGIPSLAFAVGVYLPLSTSSPIFVGGAVRWLVDKYTRSKFEGRGMSEEQLVAEGDKSNGVLLSSGYIAGGTLAGVIFAFMNIPLKDKLDQFEKWATASNPFFEGPWSDVLAMLPFLLLTVLLYVVGREWWLAPRAGGGDGVGVDASEPLRSRRPST
jgi:putative OPT family oligopeptide transporter